jgi:predicted small lipoprotein YifL
VKPPIPRRPTVLALMAASVPLTGCGLKNPYSPPPPTRSKPTAPASTASTQQADPPGERGGTIPPAQASRQNALAAGAGMASPQAALARYARLYINWNARNVVARQRQLASISLGQARAQALLAAASAARDPQLTHSNVANTGQVVTIGQGLGPAAGQWVLVTSEQTTGTGTFAGLPATLHVIYATVTHTSGEWVILAWNPRD